MPYRNDQLVGCLTSEDLDDLMNELEVLPQTIDSNNELNNPNANQFRMTSLPASSSNVSQSSTTSNQMSGHTNIRFEPLQSYFIDDSTISSQSYLNVNSTEAFDFQSSDYENQLDQFSSQLSTATSSSNYNSNLESFNNQIELNYLKELEDLMDTTQLESTNQISEQPKSSSHLHEQQYLLNNSGPQINLGQQINSSQQINLGPQMNSGPQINSNPLSSDGSVSLNSFPTSNQYPITNQIGNRIQISPNQTVSKSQQVLFTDQSPQAELAIQQIMTQSDLNAQSHQTAAFRSQHQQQKQYEKQYLTPTTHPINEFSAVFDNQEFNAINVKINSTEPTITSSSCLQGDNTANDSEFLSTSVAHDNESVVYDDFTSQAIILQDQQSRSTLPLLNPNISSNQTVLPSSYCAQSRVPNDQSTSLIDSSCSISPFSTQSSQQPQQVFCTNDKALLQQQSHSSTSILKPDLSQSNIDCFAQSVKSDDYANQLMNLPSDGRLLMNASLSNQFINNAQSSSIQLSSLDLCSPMKHCLPTKTDTSLSNNLSKVRSPSNEWLKKVANQVAQDMQRCGICVIDNFLGESFCDTILSEVVEIYGDGLFQDGLLVGNKQNGDKNIRGDKIHWVDGKEPNCQNIGYLMRTLDQVMMLFSCHNVDGGRSILNRTKAMIACYPGNATKYVKHVDNPNNDGRYITSIYYLNRHWVSARDGGNLRIFPKGVPYVANIEPLFDRMIFFWSDRRNPHEVQPAFSIRFAITLWYFDSEEREKYIKKVQYLQQQQPQQQSINQSR